MISDDNSIQIVPGYGKISQGATVPITFLVPEKSAQLYTSIIARIHPDDWVTYVDTTPRGPVRMIRATLRDDAL
jgi:hypothetical protein